jgi:hypothetical protein
MAEPESVDRRLDRVERQIDSLFAMIEDVTKTSLDISDINVPHKNGYPWWLGEGQHPPGELGGIVVDEGEARSTPCLVYPLSDTSELVFSKGIVGALDEKQKTLYCTERVVREITPAQQARIETVKKAVVTCQQEVQAIPKGDRLPPYLQCMSREMKNASSK